MGIILWVIALGLLVAASSVASYLRLLMRRLTPMGARALFKTDDPRRIRADRERVGVSISALHGVAMALYSIGVAALFIFHDSRALWEDIGEIPFRRRKYTGSGWSRRSPCFQK